jgi:hypothetical protein
MLNGPEKILQRSLESIFLEVFRKKPMADIADNTIDFGQV